jgi:predicted branched-subunit amino acid permease
MRRVLFGFGHAPPDKMRQREQAFVRGVRAGAPLLIVTAVWGVVTGVAMVNLGLSIAQATGMSLLVYSGSAQLATLPLIAGAAPIGVIWLTAAVVNLRFLIFSAALYPFFKRFSASRRLLLGSINTDIGFAIFLSRHAGAPTAERGSTAQVWFFLGISLSIWIVWQVTSITGVILAARVPPAWELGFAAIIALIALVIPMIAGAPTIVGALCAGAVAVAASGMPLRLGLLVAVLVGILAAMLTELGIERFARDRGTET